MEKRYLEEEMFIFLGWFGEHAWDSNGVAFIK